MRITNFATIEIEYSTKAIFCDNFLQHFLLYAILAVFMNLLIIPLMSPLKMA